MSPSAQEFPITYSIDELMSGMQRSRMISSIVVASLSLWAYDYALTLNLERSLIWAAPWSVPTALFLLSRYLPLMGSISIVYFLFHQGTDAGTCLVLFQLGEWSFISSIGFAEIILAIRAWAIWERDRKLTIGLPILFVSMWTTICIYAARFLKSVEFASRSITAQPSGCIVTSRSPIQFVIWVMMTGFEAVILILMSIKGYQTFKKGSNSGLTRLVYVDGILYYFALFALSMINIVVILILPHNFEDPFSFPQGILHSVLTGRMLLQLRQYEHKGHGVTEITSVSAPLEFVRNPITSAGDDIELRYSSFYY
ncbi:hypothetical protein PILCRDRAFT_534676 [Piloderma croceum F 1598]|uniref:DUF6533 domain-containing protein n=1 Tax=Piloderma croceum (strain F 1598) TaxID=765440 RepID=A0A0C3F743_PILCF|nr:hypothetical protein PILCRDRAFT_534676 [Piloderma croceum F 1598]